MNHIQDTPAYGLWPLVLINSAIFIIFAFSFFKPKTTRDWRTFGSFSAFIIALFVEMYGFPLTIYLMSGWLAQKFPGVDPLGHDFGHLWYTLLGFRGNPHLNPIHLASNLFIFGGFVLLSGAWRVLFGAQREGTLATSGPYAYQRPGLRRSRVAGKVGTGLIAAMAAPTFSRHYESRALVGAAAESVFAHVDDHARLASHMRGTMNPCECREPHDRQRLVLTGGPGAGKTAVLELIRASFCIHVKVLPEPAGIVLGGGFPRRANGEPRRAAQRAIFYVQREPEAAGDADNPAIVRCDRGTIDGAAYWPGPNDLWSAVGTTLDEQLRRYDAVIHQRTTAPDLGYNWQNPLRTESAAEAEDVDARIGKAWERHPRRFLIEPSPKFLDKAARAVEILRGEMPECCERHVVPVLGERRANTNVSSAGP